MYVVGLGVDLRRHKGGAYVFGMSRKKGYKFGRVTYFDMKFFACCSEDS